VPAAWTIDGLGNGNGRRNSGYGRNRKPSTARKFIHGVISFGQLEDRRGASFAGRRIRNDAAPLIRREILFTTETAIAFAAIAANAYF
jgi:hypothetical protein